MNSNICGTVFLFECVCVCRIAWSSQILASHSVQSHTPAPLPHNALLPTTWVYHGDGLENTEREKQKIKRERKKEIKYH